VKVPLGALALGLGGLALGLLRHPSSATWRDEWALALPVVAVLLLVSSQTGLNYLRYAFPLLPFAIISAGKWAYCFRAGRRLVGFLVLGLLAWSATSCLTVYPHTLAYFNELA